MKTMLNSSSSPLEPPVGSPATKWGQERLQRLFERYNRTYWRNRLPRYRVIPATLKGLGRCDWRKRVIEIDPGQHKNDQHVRATLLHEMAHAATRTGHGLKFFAQMERLLRRGASVTVETGDAGDVPYYGDVVPQRFPRLRKKMERLEGRRVSEINRMVANTRVAPITLTDDDLAQYFCHEDVVPLAWKDALRVVGPAYGLTDETGRPLNARARAITAKGKKLHYQAHREHLACERWWQTVQSRRKPANEADASGTTAGEKSSMIQDT